jgi:hypothetical protein
VSVADRGRPLASCWEWHGDGTRPTRRLDLVSITNMDEAASSEEGLVALRAALLAYYDEHTSALGRQPLLTRRERLMSQALERLRLKWLAIGALLVVGAVRSKRQGRPVFGDVRPLARQYGQLAGKDPDVARAEMLRMVKQLLPLDARTRRAGELPRPVTRAEFELAADALLRFYVSGRHTDDALLREIEAAYAEVDAASEAMLDRMHSEAGSASAQHKQDRERHVAANRRYVEAWLRWLDHQAAPSV